MKKLTTLIALATMLALAVVACKKEAPATEITVPVDVSSDVTADDVQ